MGADLNRQTYSPEGAFFSSSSSPGVFFFRRFFTWSPPAVAAAAADAGSAATGGTCLGFLFFMGSEVLSSSFLFLLRTLLVGGD